MEFLKKHYEKLVLCVVLLGLAATVLWMKSAIEKVREQAPPVPQTQSPVSKSPTVKPVDLAPYSQALSQVTNPPALVLSGEHNLFNPVTWKRRFTGEIFKVLKTGSEALAVTNIIPLYTIITLDQVEGGVFTIALQKGVDLTQPKSVRAAKAHLHLNEMRTNQFPFIVRGIKGPEDAPTDVNLELLPSGETNAWSSASSPYKQVESYLADLKYDPDPTVPLLRKKVKDRFKLDGEPYIIVEITNEAVRVEDEKTTRVTEIKWMKSP